MLFTLILVFTHRSETKKNRPFADTDIFNKKTQPLYDQKVLWHKSGSSLQ
jgi:hypothetical protein